MYPSGFDNVIYSDLEPKQLISKFLKMLEELWSTPVFDEMSSPFEEMFKKSNGNFFIGKDDEMLKIHDEKGYQDT